MNTKINEIESKNERTEQDNNHQFEAIRHNMAQIGDFPLEELAFLWLKANIKFIKATEDLAKAGEMLIERFTEDDDVI